MDRLLGLPEALKTTALALDHDGQVGYFVECVLGGMHGLRVDDLVAGLSLAVASAGELGRRIAAAALLEHELFLQATSLDEIVYRQIFPRVPAAVWQALFA